MASTSPGGLRVQILGPLRIWRDGVEVEPGPRQQTYLLALLLARAGDPISINELIDLIWPDDAPATVLNVIQKYIGALRRQLEPALAPRETGAYLHRRGSGYLFVADPEVLDVAAFRQLIDTANDAVASQHGDVALDAYLRALSLWNGPAADGLRTGWSAANIVSSLDQEFFDACIAATELAIGLRRAGDVLGPLRLAGAMAPLNEPIHAALMNALTAAGDRAEAITVYRRVRARLVDELGIDPGPALESAHRRIRVPAPVGTDPVEQPTPGASSDLVGRGEELAVLRRGVEAALDNGTGIVVVEGEPGGGKTRLVQEASTFAQSNGAQVVWGQCLQGDGTPPLWPWIQVIEAILHDMPEPERQKRLTGALGRLASVSDDSLVLPDNNSRFLLFEDVVALLGQATDRHPIVLVVDDLQWADTVSLELLDHLAARLPKGSAVIGALRTRAPAPGSALIRTLASMSRLPGHHRVRIGPLGSAEVAELIGRQTGQSVSSVAVRHIATRTGGNPFFVRELSCFLSDAGAITEEAAAQPGVPMSVRDVVRDRMTGLDVTARDLLQVAALTGRDVELGVLIRAAGLDAQTCLVRLESMEALGLLEPVPGDPFSRRFPHDLVRESVADTTSAARAPHLHLRIADALDHSDPDGDGVVERIAHHLWSAGPLADPTRTAEALMRAGRRAASRFAFGVAERLLRSAVEMARAATLPTVELPALSELIAVHGMQHMWNTEKIELLERAEFLARKLDRDGDALTFMLSQWTAYTDELDVDSAGRVAERMLELADSSSDQVVRIFGLFTWATQQWSTGNLGDGVRTLRRLEGSGFTYFDREETDPTARHLHLLMSGTTSELLALDDRLEECHALLDRMETAAGDDPYCLTIWASVAGRVGVETWDTPLVLRATERGLAVDPDFSFGYLGISLRIARCWVLAMTGQDATAAAAEAQRILETHILNPPRSMAGQMCVFVAATHLAAGALGDAAAALDRADHLHRTHGQRYAEGQQYLARAELLQAQGASSAAVRAAAEEALRYARDHENRLYERRAGEFLRKLPE